MNFPPQLILNGTHRFLRCCLPLLVIVGCAHTSQPNRADHDRRALLQIVDDYAHLGRGDPQKFLDLFWIDDPSFTVIENDRPHVMGAQYIRHLADLIRGRPNQPLNQRFHDTRVHLLADDFAYSVFLRDELNIARTSRVTFVYQRKSGVWRIIHAHFSYLPD